MQIIDRKSRALGGQTITGYVGRYRNGRSYDDIKDIVWHYTGVARKQRRTIEDHERWWKQLDWSRGGYHYYIDADGKIFQNYDPRRITFGAGNINDTALHISVEANSSLDYSDAQVKARDFLTRKLMNDFNIPASKVIGHREAPGQSTACPGYTIAQMNEFRRSLGRTPSPVTKVVEIEDKDASLELTLKDLKFESSQWGTKLINAKGEFTVGGSKIMSRFERPNITAPRGGHADPGYTLKFDQIAIAGGFVWLRYYVNKRVKYLPIAGFNNGEVVNNEFWGTF